MRTVLLAATLTLGFTAVANAGQPASQTPSAEQGGRVVFVCDRSAESRRTWEREHGAAMVFVSADDLAKADQAKETWSTPRCISGVELRRYHDAMSDARVLQTRGTK